MTAWVARKFGFNLSRCSEGGGEQPEAGEKILGPACSKQTALKIDFVSLGWPWCSARRLRTS